MSTWQARRLFSEHFDAWDAMVARHPRGSLFHTAGFLQNVCNAPLTIVGLYRDDRLAGGFAFPQPAGRWIRLIIPPPLTPLFAPLLPDYETQGDHREQDKAIRELFTCMPGVDGVELVHPYDNMPEPPNRVTKRQRTVNDGYLAPCGSENKLLDRYPPAFIAALRKARDRGCTLSRSLDASAFYRLAKSTYERRLHRFPLTEHRLTLLYRMLEQSGRLAVIGVIDEDREPVAGQLMVRDGEQLYCLVSAGDPDGPAATYALHHSLLYAMQQGASYRFNAHRLELQHKLLLRTGLASRVPLHRTAIYPTWKGRLRSRFKRTFSRSETH